MEEDDELREKLYDLRVNVFSTKKISNVVEENEKLKFQLDEAHTEIGRLRKQILLISFGMPKAPGSASRRRFSNPIPQNEQSNAINNDR